MTTTDRPFLTSKTRYRQLLRLAKECNGAELLVSDEDWDILLECVPGASRFADTESLIHKGRRWRCKPPTKPPEGTYDITGEIPVRVYE